ncbi:hypothetical protein DYB32_006814, partial [Aphanomyces invadans]
SERHCIVTLERERAVLTLVHEQVHANCKVGCGSVVGEGVVVGPDSHIGTALVSGVFHFCALYRQPCHACELHRGEAYGHPYRDPHRPVMEQDGFGFMLNDTGDHGKKPQELAVEIHDDVEIGTTLGNRVYVGGQVGITQHLKIGDNVRIAARSGVMHDLPSNATYGGVPAMPIMQYRRLMAVHRDASLKKPPT